MSRRLACLLAACAFLALIPLFSPGAEPSGTPGPARELNDSEKANIENAVRDRLKDPESARFKWPPYRDGAKYYCGLVNAKNSMGGYVGFESYIVFFDVDAAGKKTVSLTMLDSADQSERLVVSHACDAPGPG